ncbi:hypothetical protein [Opitutus sp. ER46]|uniref:hypothetical protein n=1 Tax=Opitutus sp. ER46 TaxID=2161864 RepID=UPI0011B1E5F8|nr:hypothetical protein [Opitutus sp. ER46]
MRPRLFMRQAGLMCMGRKALHPEDHWAFALWPEENSPVDAVFRRRSPAGNEEFEFVQLKEFVPEDLNPRQSLQSLLDRLMGRYPEAGGFTIGINVNRDATTNLGQLRVPPLRNGSIWLFGVGGEAPFDCFLLGDLLRPAELTGCFFMHPRFQPGESPLSLGNMAD